MQGFITALLIISGIRPIEPLFIPPNSPVVESLPSEGTSTPLWLSVENLGLINRAYASQYWDSCVSYVRQRISRQFPRVEEAYQIPVISDKPDIGSVAIFRYTNSGHAAYVTQVDKDSFEIDEWGFKKNELTHRTIMNNDKFLLGFWR